MTEPASVYRMPERQEVICTCGFHVFDRIIVRTRALRILPTGAVEAKCRCKRWVHLPLHYSRQNN